MNYSFESHLASVLNEMAMDLTKVGDWENDYQEFDPNSDTDRWDDQSRKTFRSDKAVTKIKRIADKTLYHFNVYLVRLNENHKLNRIAYSPGGVSYPINMIDKFYEAVGISQDKAPVYNDKINLFLVAWQDEPPTAWMILHRFAHTASNLFMYDCYQALKKHIRAPEGSANQLKALESVLTMRSARMGKLNQMDEALREAMVQYLMSGQVTLEARTEFSKLVDVRGLQNSINQIFNSAAAQFYNYVYIM